MTARHSIAAAIELESENSGMAATGPPRAIGCFQPLDPDIVNEAVPAFFVGRNKNGFWVTRDVRGRIGGIFLFRNSALSFAKRHSRAIGCATIFPFERFELDLENNGNRFVSYLEPLLCATLRPRRRMAVLTSNMVMSIKRQLSNFQTL
jgi:hypothetical protein